MSQIRCNNYEISASTTSTASYKSADKSHLLQPLPYAIRPRTEQMWAEPEPLPPAKSVKRKREKDWGTGPMTFKQRAIYEIAGAIGFWIGLH